MAKFFAKILRKRKKKSSEASLAVESSSSAGVPLESEYYNQDNLRTLNNHDFMQDAQFTAAYQRGVQAAGVDYNWHWRVHVGLWAAWTASRLPGDFVECGVGNGFLASAVMESLGWNRLVPARDFYLMDTFSGIDARYLSPAEVEAKGDAESQNAAFKKAGVYASGMDRIRANFAEWNNVHIIKGPIPETLVQAKTRVVSFLHIDMNCIPPEVAAFEYFWELVVAGGVILFDDYAYYDHTLQKRAMDQMAAKVGHQILSLPTGQGLLIKA
tara:strand:+ start:808 stop:1617 length:810 start_codon:yes stop_codon:yes gene_type:complete